METNASSGLLLAFYDPLQLLQTKPFEYTVKCVQGTKASSSAWANSPAIRADLADLNFCRGAVSAWLSPGPSSGGAPGSGAAATATAELKLAVSETILNGLLTLGSRLHGLVCALADASAQFSAPAGPAAVSAGGGGGGRVDGEGAGGAAGNGGAASSNAASAPGVLAAVAAATAGLARSEWTSALSSRPQRLLRLDSLPQELALVYNVYAAALRHQAHQQLQLLERPPASSGVGGDGDAADGPAGSGSSGGGSSRAQSPAAVAGSALRRAAGVYEYLAEVLLPELAAAEGEGERPLELVPAAARCMQVLCLAEAQALMAATAVARGMSSGTQRALHAGCAALFRRASKAAAELSGGARASSVPAPSDRLVRLLAVSAALHSARAHYCLARERQREMKMGEAEASCEEGSKLLGDAMRCLDRSDPPAWASSIKAQQDMCAQLYIAVQKDRLAVTYEALPRQPPDAAANAATSVTPEPFQPAPALPPECGAREPDRGPGGCHIM